VSEPSDNQGYGPFIERKQTLDEVVGRLSTFERQCCITRRLRSARSDRSAGAREKWCTGIDASIPFVTSENCHQIGLVGNEISGVISTLNILPLFVVMPKAACV
jgi:hypothetical protein